MRLVVNIQDWLDEKGRPERHLRRRVLRLARLIEYGGPMRADTWRETLVECSRRPMGVACDGLLWVTKRVDDLIEAWCPLCRGEQIYISGWQSTDWAAGPMVPEPMDARPIELAN